MQHNVTISLSLLKNLTWRPSMNDTINVKIPLHLLFQTIYLLECLDICVYDQSVQIDYYNVLSALNKKKDALELRESYSKIIRAENDASRHTARMQYLKHKRCLRGDF